MSIELDDIKEFFSAARDGHFIDRVLQNTQRYIDLFSQVVDLNLPKPSKNFREQDQTPFEILMEQRRYNIQQNYEHAVNQGFAKPNSDPTKSVIPKELERCFQVFIVNGEFGKKNV